MGVFRKRTPPATSRLGGSRRLDRVQLGVVEPNEVVQQSPDAAVKPNEWMGEQDEF